MSPIIKSIAVRLNRLSLLQSIKTRRLKLFGHIVHSDPDEDHVPALIDEPPKNWRRPRGRPRQTWLRTVEQDLDNKTLSYRRPGNLHKNELVGNIVVKTATLQQGLAP